MSGEKTIYEDYNCKVSISKTGYIQTSWRDGRTEIHVGDYQPTVEVLLYLAKQLQALTGRNKELEEKLDKAIESAGSFEMECDTLREHKHRLEHELEKETRNSNDWFKKSEILQKQNEAKDKRIAELEEALSKIANNKDCVMSLDDTCYPQRIAKQALQNDKDHIADVSEMVK